MSLLQRDCHEILAGIGEGRGKWLSAYTNYVISSAKLYTSKFTKASRGFPAKHGFLVMLSTGLSHLCPKNILTSPEKLRI